jgi:tRNA(Arg) A34 adenosine deaminase TadA
MLDQPRLTLDNLAAPWRVCFELAWDAYGAGSIGVGAVIVDGAGIIAASGRNRTGELTAPANQLANTGLAHAEVNALAGLPLGDHTAYTLYTTLEPCFLCRAAIILSRIGHVRYAGRDLLREGLERIPELNPYVRRRWPQWEGPLKGPLAIWSMLLLLMESLLMESLRSLPDGFVVQVHEAAMPELVDLGRILLESGELAALTTETLDDALGAVWPRLASTAGQLGY